MTTEQPLSEKESLEIITTMIDKVKACYHDKGIGPILWGSVITICSLVSYCVIVYIKPQWWFNIWYLAIIAILPQIYFSIKERKEKQFTSLTDDALTAVWATFGFSMFMLSIISNHNNHGISIAIYLLIYGIPTIITGWITKFTIMLIGGVMCWLCSIVSLYVSVPNQYLLMAASTIMAWLIPGIILNIKYRKQKTANV